MKHDIIVPYDIKYEDTLDFIKRVCNNNGPVLKTEPISVAELNLSNSKISYYNKKIDEHLQSSLYKRVTTYHTTKIKMTIECKKCKYQHSALYHNIMKCSYNDCK